MTNKKLFQHGWWVWLVLALPSLAAAENQGVRYYVSLGTSLSVGIQPDSAGVNQRTDDGYADQLFDIIEPQYRKIKLHKLGCPGETTVTMMTGGICTYDEGSQLAEAVAFLHAHKGKVALVTIDIGVNDILAGGCIQGLDFNVPCIIDVFGQIGTNLPVILSALREAADSDTRIVGMNYYNSFLGFWFAGEQGQAIAALSQELAGFLNYALLGPTYNFFGIDVADVGVAFSSDTETIVPGYGLPLNVLRICQWTYMCVDSPIGPNIHANPTGYGVIAATLAATIDGTAP